MLELRLFGRGPSLLRFGRPTIQATSTVVCCSYPIEGGLLAQRRAGEIAFAQIGGSPLVVHFDDSWLLPKPRRAPGRTELSRCALQ